MRNKMIILWIVVPALVVVFGLCMFRTLSTASSTLPPGAHQITVSEGATLSHLLINQPPRPAGKQDKEQSNFFAIIWHFLANIFKLLSGFIAKLISPIIVGIIPALTAIFVPKILDGRKNQRVQSIKNLEENYKKSVRKWLSDSMKFDLSNPASDSATAIKIDFDKDYIKPQLRLSMNISNDLLEPTKKHTYEPETLMRIRQMQIEKQPENTAKAVEVTGRWRLVLGSPGSGKTAYLKYQAWRESEPSSTRFPIYVDLKDFIPSTDSTLLKYIAVQLHKNYQLGENVGESEKYILQQMEHGNAFLLIDGLDTIKTQKGKNMYDKVVEEIKQYANSEKYKDLQLYVALRNVADGEFIGFEKGIIEEFHLRDIRALVESKNVIGKESNPYLQTLIDNSVRFQMFASNPRGLLYIAWNCSFKKDVLPLPLHRAKIYEEFINESIDKIHFASDAWKFTYTEAQELYATVAWKMQKHGTDICEEKTLQNEIGEILLVQISSPDSSGLSRDIKKQLEDAKVKIIQEVILPQGLLRKKEEGYRFLSLPLQEYFAAKYAILCQEKQDVLCQQYNNPWWEEVLLLYIYLLYDGKEQEKIKGVLARLAKEETTDTEVSRYMCPLIRGHGSVMGGSRVTEDVVKEIKLRLWMILFESKCLFIQAQISHILKDLQAKLTREICEELLQELATNGNATTSLPVNLSDYINQPIPLILLPYLDCNNNHTHAFKTLNNMDKKSIYNVLKGRTSWPGGEKTSIPAPIRMSMVVALRLFVLDNRGDYQNTAELRVALEELLEKPIDKNVKASIAITLGMIGNKETTSKLFQWLGINREDADVFVAWHVVGALGILGERFGYWEADTSICIVDQFKMLLKDENINVIIRWHIVMILLRKVYHLYDKDAYEKARQDLSIDRFPFPDTTLPGRAIKILLEEENDDAIDKNIIKWLDNLENLPTEKQLTDEQLNYLCETVGLVAHNIDVATCLKEVCERFCRNHKCSLPPDVQEKLKYTYWLVMRRQLASGKSKPDDASASNQNKAKSESRIP